MEMNRCTEMTSCFFYTVKFLYYREKKNKLIFERMREMNIISENDKTENEGMYDNM